MDEDMIAAVASGLRDEVEQNAAMRRIEVQHTLHCCTPAEHADYFTLWIAATLRRSPGRAPYLPPVADELLAERARLVGDIRQARARMAVEEAFGATPEDELPVTAAS